MHTLDIEHWPRKAHYHFFRNVSYPHFNLCAPVDITRFMQYREDTGLPFFIPLLFLAMKAINEVDNLRMRIRDDTVVVHDAVHPSFTVMGEDAVFGFCDGHYHPDYAAFATRAAADMARTRNQPTLDKEADRDDQIFITSIPWVAFTSFVHPLFMQPVDSIPRLSFGKWTEEQDRIRLPVSLQAHHALADGQHVGQFFMRLQALLDEADRHLGA